MNKTVIFIAGIVFFLFFGIGRWVLSAPDNRRGEPIVADLTPALSTPAPTATPTPPPAPTGEAARVQFQRGSYGETLAGDSSQRYLLWAASGQVFTATLTSNAAALVSLYGPDGAPLYEQLASGYTAAASLPATGDYQLEVRSSGAYTVGVMIR